MDGSAQFWLSALSLAALFIAHDARAGDPVAGKQHYVAICSGCHGIDGVAVLDYAPSFARGENLDKDDATPVQSVRDGVFRMPPWGDVLTERQIADAIAYARTLRKRQ